MLSELLITNDGSHTLFVSEIDECYHSTQGAIQESLHIFIEAGLKQCSKPEIHVLEIGFGTGLNAFLTMIEAEKSNKKIHYTTIEKFPIDVEKASQLNYPEKLSPLYRKAFEMLHLLPWNEEVQMKPNFLILKIQADFTQLDFTEMYDVVYFDAFSPEKQPEMWSEALFVNIFKQCNSSAIFTTYCSKGIVRRALQYAGFKVERLEGPPGKREILRGLK